MPQACPPDRLRRWPTASELAHALRRRRRPARALGVIAGVAAAVAVWVAMPAGRHEAVALLHLKPDPSRPGPDPDFGGFKLTQVRLLQSRAVFDRVAGDPYVARRLDGRRVERLEASTRVRWESPDLLAVTMTGDDPGLLRAALDVLVAEYLRDAATEDGVGRMRQRRAIEERLAEPESTSPTEAESRAALRQELVRLDLADRAGPRVVRREGPVVHPNRNLGRKAVRSAGASAVGWLAVLALVALAEWRLRRVDSAGQVADALGLPVLGTLPTQRPETWRTAPPAASARDALLHAVRDRSLQVFAVVSSARDEGPTALAVRLAADLAAAGLRTLLLDGDPHEPSLHARFDTPRAPGFGELLLQEVDVAESTRPTTVPNLWLIPAGERSDRVAAALAQRPTVGTLLDRLRRQYDVVVIDAGPVLPVVGASGPVRYADGVVLSVVRDVSRLPLLAAGVEALTRLDAPILGVVVCGVGPGHDDQHRA